MFTGIVEATAEILEKTPAGLVIERPVAFDDLNIGSSVSVSGVCLTIVRLAKTSMAFDVVEETRRVTTLGFLKKGDRVNLEQSMKANDRFDGHIVQGHVEGVGVVAATGEGSELVLCVPTSLLPGIVTKGSIAIDGVSLTVASVAGDRVTVALIPQTLKSTTLGSFKTGDRVNIETDILGRYVLQGGAF